jgi:hypothetical protein
LSKQPETKFKEKVMEDLKTLPKIWFTKIQQVSIRGIPDILLCRRGKFVALELKVDSDESELQSYNLAKIKQAGGKSFTATPKNWEEIFQELKELR